MTEQTLKEKIEKILWHPDFHDETHQNYPTIKVSWTKDGLEILTNQLLSLIQDYSREKEKEIRADISIDLYQLNWITILVEAIQSRQTSWGTDPVIEFRNASDEILGAMMRQAIEKGIFKDSLIEAAKLFAKRGKVSEECK